MSGFHLSRACWPVATSSCFPGWVREWQQTWEKPSLHLFSGITPHCRCKINVQIQDSWTSEGLWFCHNDIASHSDGWHSHGKKISLVPFVSDKMWLFLMPTKLDSWSTVWQLTFKSSSHRLNWSSLRYELLHLHRKYTVILLASKYLFLILSLQGLRSLTQTAGCFVSLYIISPKLTGLTVVVLPCLVGAGALIGSFLRKLSRLAQEQVMRKCDIALIWRLLSLLPTNVLLPDSFDLCGLSLI